MDGWVLFYVRSPKTKNLNSIQVLTIMDVIENM